ncbi:hypothetical protein HOG17_02670 [Candidatus Peregrinibacteria bacterium]|jgi:hypothetical protein|nr:hypothetical protein [Candidatus Peregrinibacteria bacterium]MBT4147802.1 hypothetical protein [Candidatus Peregrinibacteria bacterium]MBT4366548.1 hypothetical protein [Candidatus Peregrinibacteria bacterium]MBT4456112.1 hypothetical protein [Candidatus Peregrinibacteria bacterium]
MGLFGSGSEKEKGGDVIDLGRKVEDAEKKKKEGEKDKRLVLLSSIVEQSGELKEAETAKDSVSSMILKWAIEKPWLVEFQLLSLYQGVDPQDNKESIEMFSGEVKYMGKKIKLMRSEIKGADIGKDEKRLALKNLKLFSKALDRLEDYLENLMDLSDKERKNIHNVDEDDLSRAQRRVLEDEDDVVARKEVLGKKVKGNKDLKAKIQKIAGAM